MLFVSNNFYLCFKFSRAKKNDIKSPPLRFEPGTTRWTNSRTHFCHLHCSLSSELHKSTDSLNSAQQLSFPAPNKFKITQKLKTSRKIPIKLALEGGGERFSRASELARTDSHRVRTKAPLLEENSFFFFFSFLFSENQNNVLFIFYFLFYPIVFSAKP